MWNRSQIAGIILILVSLLFAACAPKTAPVQAPGMPAAPSAKPAPQIPAPVAAAKPAWETRWEETIAGAKKEGKVVIYTSAGPRGRVAIQQGLSAAYPIDVELIAGVTAQLAEKIVAEQRAGLHLADIALVGATDPVSRFKPAGILERLDQALILPEVANPKVWRGGELPFADKDHTVIGFTSNLSGFLTVNTEMVKPGEIKPWRDLLQPKWKKQIVMFGPALASGPGVMWSQAIGRGIMGWDYLRELAKQEPIITEDARLQAEWIARGKYAMGTGTRAELVDEFIGLGLPIQDVAPSEGVYMTYSTGAFGLLKSAPHPNAARVFINWLLGKEGQVITCQGMAYTSARTDVAVPSNLASRAPAPNTTYFNSTSEENILQKTEDLKILKEIFGPLKK